MLLIHSPRRQKCKHTESDKLSVQIQAYLDNVFDVGGLLEDAETKNAALEKVEELEEHLSHVSEAPNLTTRDSGNMDLC